MGPLPCHRLGSASAALEPFLEKVVRTRRAGRAEPTSEGTGGSLSCSLDSGEELKLNREGRSEEGGTEAGIKPNKQCKKPSWNAESH